MASMLDALVAKYRQMVAGRQAAATELEIRFGVDWANFETIYNSLVAKKIAAGDGKVSQVVNVITEAGGGRPPQGMRSQRIRQIEFTNGKKSADRYTTKASLARPVRVTNPAGLSYSVALSSENADAVPFDAGEGSLIRVKSRSSFAYSAPAVAFPGVNFEWRIDATVVRQIDGPSATSSLKTIVQTMFPEGVAATPEKMLAELGLDADASKRKLYGFEIEAELVKATGQIAGEANALIERKAGESKAVDALRPADVTSMANSILQLANPTHVSEALYQAEVYHIAGFVVQTPGLLRQYEYQLGLKRLVPQVIALTRAGYREIYPPVGFYATDKTDGLRALVSVRGGVARILADKLYEFSGGAEAAQHAGVTIVDAEYTPDPKKGEGKGAVYVFDVIAVEGKSFAADGIEVRITHIDAAVAALRAYGVDAHAKPYVEITSDDPEQLKKEFKSVLDAKRPYAIDGLILAKPGDDYFHTKAYKAKPLEHNTIDFLVRKCPARLLGNAPFVRLPGHTLYFLFTGISPGMYEAIGLQRCPGYSDLFGEPVGGVRQSLAPLVPPVSAPASRLPANTGSYFPIQFQPSDFPTAYLYQHPDGAKIPTDDEHPPTARAAESKKSVANGVPAKAAESKKPATAKAAESKKPVAAPKPVELKAAESKESKEPENLDLTVLELLPEGEFSAQGVRFVKWKPVRLRHDRMKELKTKRYYGNDFRIAELTWLNYVDPFPLEQMWDGPALDYFVQPKSGIYKAQTAYNSFVKSRRIGTLRHSNWVVDLAFGKGQDFGRYLDAEVRHLIAVDKDRAALAEAIRRKYSHLEKRQHRRRGGTALHVAVADLLRPNEETAALLHRLGLPDGGADAVVCNFAIHYFTGSLPSMRNFVVLCHKCVKVGGQVIITAFSGQRVHETFVRAGIAEGKSWDVREPPLGGVLKYSLRRQYAGAALQLSGQKMGVLLPFSDGQYYEEYLVNYKALKEEFIVRDFKLVTETNAASLLEEFEAENPSSFAALTAYDKKYIGLYGELVLQRTK
jgi:hypothetical protein